MNSIESLIDNLSLLKNLYDVVRIVDPVRKRTVYYNKGKVEIMKDSCYGMWKLETPCINCISMRAYNGNDTFVKIEYNKEKIYIVTASPVTIDNNKYVFEMLKDITNTGIIEDYNNKTTDEIQNLINKMNTLVVKDELTKIYNRRFINERLPIDILKSISLKNPLSVIMTDIDFFKSVNDNYGHLKGDFVLFEFASLLNRNIRKDIDWVARYGGEEFLIILDNVDNDAAYDISEKIRKEVEQKVIKCEESEIKITASFGICTLDEFSSKVDINKLIGDADKNLYEAKKTGRNKTVR